MQGAQKFKDLICDFIINKPTWALGLFLLVFASTSYNIIKIQSDFSVRVWYSEKDPNLQSFDFFENTFGNDDSVILVIEIPELFTPKQYFGLKEMTEEAWDIEDVARVDSLTNLEVIKAEGDDLYIGPLVEDEDIVVWDDVRKRAINDSLLVNNVISPDGKVVMVILTMKKILLDKIDYSKIVSGSRKLVEKYERKMGWNISLFGNAFLTQAYKELIEKDVSRIYPLLFTICTLLFIFIFRSLWSVFYFGLVVFVSNLMMLGSQGYLGFTFNVISSIASQVLLTVAMADVIHILSSVQYGLNNGMNGRDSVIYSLRKNFFPTLFTSVTTAFGFMSFYSADIGPVSELGVIEGIGVFITWFTTYFLMGPLLLKFTKDSHYKKGKNLFNFNSHNYVNLVYNNKKGILVTSFLFSVIGILIFTMLKINLNPFNDFPKDHDLIQGYNKIEENFKGPISVDILIDSTVEEGVSNPEFLTKVEILDKWLLSQNEIFHSSSVLNIIKSLNKKFRNLNEEILPRSRKEISEILLFYNMALPVGRELTNRMSLNKRFIRLTAFWNIQTSNESLQLIEKINLKAKELGLTARVTGKVPLFHNLTPYVVSTFFKSFILALAVIAFLLVFSLKSIKMGIYSLVPNIVPLLLGSYVYYFLEQAITMTDVLIASVCFGIAVDDTIHIMFEYKKSRERDMSKKESFSSLLETTFPALFFTTFTIIIGFTTFLLADYNPNKTFGMMVALLLSFALIVDLTVLPAILFLTDDKKEG